MNYEVYDLRSLRAGKMAAFHMLPPHAMFLSLIHITHSFCVLTNVMKNTLLRFQQVNFIRLHKK